MCTLHDANVADSISLKSRNRLVDQRKDGDDEVNPLALCQRAANKLRGDPSFRLEQWFASRP